MPVADDFRARLREVLACPTGPLHEQRVHAVIRAAARASPRLRDRIDRYGNLEVVYGKGRPELFFATAASVPARSAWRCATTTTTANTTTTAATAWRPRASTPTTPRTSWSG